MVLIKDPINEFYIHLTNKRVLVFLSESVDSICTWVILRKLFTAEHVLYSVCSVRKISDLVEEFKAHHACQPKCSVLLINCGACLDVVDLLGSHHEIFILDNLRPFHLSNVLSRDKVKLVVNRDELEVEYNHIPWQSLSADEADSTDVEEVKKKYYSASYHPYPSALIAFQIAYLTSRDDMFFLWCTAVALSDLFANGRIPKRAYLIYCGILEAHSARINDPGDEERRCWPTFAYEHKRLNGYYQYVGTLSDFFRKSINMYTIFNLAQHNGRRKLAEWFGELGIAIEDTTKIYATAGIRARSGVALTFQKQYMRKYRYNENTIALPMFRIRFDCIFDITAMDFAMCIQALLVNAETQNRSSGYVIQQCAPLFLWYDTEPLKSAIEAGKILVARTIDQMQEFITLDQIISYDWFYYLELPYEHRDRLLWTSASSLRLLAYYILTERYFHVIRRYTHRDVAQVHRITKFKNMNHKNLGIVLGVPTSETRIMMVGIQEYEEDELNPFFHLFVEGAARGNIEIVSDHFEKNVIELDIKDRWNLVYNMSDIVMVQELGSANIELADWEKDFLADKSIRNET